jgi:hypothetical protein
MNSYNPEFVRCAMLLEGSALLSALLLLAGRPHRHLPPEGLPPAAPDRPTGQPVLLELRRCRPAGCRPALYLHAIITHPILRDYVKSKDPPPRTGARNY